jgi:MFS family permease
MIAPALAVGSNYPSRLRAHATLVLLMLAAVFAYADVQLFALLATRIKTTFHLSDTSLGVLQGLALTLSTAAALAPVGWTVDKSNRIRLLMAAAGLWSLFTLLTGLSANFTQLFLCRVGVGVAEAVVYPAAYSLIADLYPPNRRGLVVSVFIAGALIGASAATALSGTLIGMVDTTAATPGGAFWGLPAWRLTFLLVAIPGLVLALALAAVREPLRQVFDVEVGHVAAPSFLRFLAQRRGLLGRLIGAIVLSQLAMTSVFFWVPSVFTRMFGFSEGRAGEWLGIVFGLGSLGGVALSTVLVALLRRKGEFQAPLTVLKIGVALAAIGVIALPLARSPYLLAAAITAFIGFIYVGIAVSPTLLMAVAPSSFRGRLISLQTLILWLATAITPPLVGLLSDRIFTGPQGLVLAFSAVAIPCSVLPPLLLWRIQPMFVRALVANPAELRAV